MDRRDFLTKAGVGAATLGLGVQVAGGQTTKALSLPPVYVFSKHLQFLDFEKMPEIAAALGFDGVDLTVRKGGHVLPERARKDLPKAIRAIRKAGLAAETISTDILESEDPLVREVLEVARDEGITQYRLRGSIYDLKASIEDQLEAWKTSVGRLAALNEAVGIQGSIQNHSRFYLGGQGVEIWYAIRDLNPAYMSCQFDVCHAAAEGAVSWPVGFKLMAPRVTALIIKDFQFEGTDDGIRRKFVPVGSGMVPWKRYWSLVRETGMQGPFILHMEYGNRRQPETEKAFLKKDLMTVRSMMREAWPQQS